MGNENTVAQHHGQISKTPAVGGSPTCKLISMYLHNEAQPHFPRGPKALHHGGYNQSWFRGLGRELVRASGLFSEDPGRIFPHCSFHHPFLFHQEPVVLSLLKLGFCLVVAILIPRMGHPGW